MGRRYLPSFMGGGAAAAAARAKFGGGASTQRAGLRVATWNIAAINNNPFEYWTTLDANPGYARFMDGVQAFVAHPRAGDDVPLAEVLTPAMFAELEARMLALSASLGAGDGDTGWGAGAVRNAARAWRDDLSQRRIVSQFLKDGSLGKKRLASMPDRVTNTLHDAAGAAWYRPTVINCYLSLIHI